MAILGFYYLLVWSDLIWFHLMLSFLAVRTWMDFRLGYDLSISSDYQQAIVFRQWNSSGIDSALESHSLGADRSLLTFRFWLIDYSFNDWFIGDVVMWKILERIGQHQWITAALIRLDLLDRRINFCEFNNYFLASLLEWNPETYIVYSSCS